MRRFGITNPDQIVPTLRTFAAFDDIRWANAPNYNLINYCSEDLSADEKLLTHWISYIADRQMPFMRVWEVGGYVLSHLVREFERSGKTMRSLADEHIQRRRGEDGKDKIVFQSPMDGPNRRLELQGITRTPVRFASRYIPEDALLMFRTLTLLDEVAGRRFAGFAALFISDSEGIGENIRRLAIAFDGLTYSAAGAVTADQLANRMTNLSGSLAQDVSAIRKDPSAWLESRRKTFRPFGKKRLWCSLRDYLKSPEFNPCFVQALADAGFQNAHRWKSTNQELRRALDQMELPGDVWNNNEVFANGLFLPYLQNKPKTWDMPRTVRAIYEAINDRVRGVFYPEQLDVTFDFVPRMCERQMCHVCPFGGGVSKLCHQQQNLLCPVPLVACGYQHMCRPENCEFKSDATRGVCRHWQAIATEK